MKKYGKLCTKSQHITKSVSAEDSPQKASYKPFTILNKIAIIIEKILNFFFVCRLIAWLEY